MSHIHCLLLNSVTRLQPARQKKKTKKKIQTNKQEQKPVADLEGGVRGVPPPPPPPPPKIRKAYVIQR